MSFGHCSRKAPSGIKNPQVHRLVMNPVFAATGTISILHTEFRNERALGAHDGPFAAPWLHDSWPATGLPGRSYRTSPERRTPPEPISCGSCPFPPRCLVRRKRARYTIPCAEAARIRGHRQVVRHQLPKLTLAGSSPVARSRTLTAPETVPFFIARRSRPRRRGSYPPGGSSCSGSGRPCTRYRNVPRRTPPPASSTRCPRPAQTSSRAPAAS